MFSHIQRYVAGSAQRSFAAGDLSHSASTTGYKTQYLQDTIDQQMTTTRTTMTKRQHQEQQQRTEATWSYQHQQQQATTMWARNSSRDAERAQDDADFGAAPCDGGNRFPEDDTGHVTFRAATKGVGPSAGDPNFHQSLSDAIAGLYLGDGKWFDESSVDGFLQEEEEDEDNLSMVETACQPTTGGGHGQGRGGGLGQPRRFGSGAIRAELQNHVTLREMEDGIVNTAVYSRYCNKIIHFATWVYENEVSWLTDYGKGKMEEMVVLREDERAIGRRKHIKHEWMEMLWNAR
jgi:hypothetical protein